MPPFEDWPATPQNIHSFNLSLQGSFNTDWIFDDEKSGGKNQMRLYGFSFFFGHKTHGILVSQPGSNPH